MTQPKAKLIYVGDPMCSWCYGISENMSEIKNSYKSKLDFEIVMGGLRPYNTQTMSELKDFLIHHWEDVNRASGLPFSYGILDKDDITYDTEPPCRAVMLVRNKYPEKAFSFFKEVQKAFYVENKNLHLLNSYEEICVNLDIPYEFLKSSFDQTQSKNLIKKDFERSAELGVNSFPTLLLEKDGKLHVLAKGFATVSEIQEKVTRILDR